MNKKEMLTKRLNNISKYYDKKVTWMTAIRRYFLLDTMDYILFFPYLFKNERFFKRQIDQNIKEIKRTEDPKEMREIIENSYTYVKDIHDDIINTFRSKNNLKKLLIYYKTAKDKRKKEKKYFSNFIAFYSQLLEEFQSINQDTFESSTVIDTANSNKVLHKSEILTSSNFRNLFIHRRKKRTDTKFSQGFPEDVLIKLNNVFKELGIESEYGLNDILEGDLSRMQITRGIGKKKPAYLLTFFFCFISRMFVKEGVQEEFVAIISNNHLIINKEGEPIESDLLYRELREPMKGDRLRKIRALYNKVFQILVPICTHNREVKYNDVKYLIEKDNFFVSNRTNL